MASLVWDCLVGRLDILLPALWIILLSLFLAAFVFPLVQGQGGALGLCKVEQAKGHFSHVERSHHFHEASLEMGPN